MSTVLPTETWSEIFEHCDRDSLCNLRRVDRHMADLLTPLIFSTIYFGWQARHLDALTSIASHPTIKRSVRRLVVEVDSPWLDGRSFHHFQEKAVSFQNVRWINRNFRRTPWRESVEIESDPELQPVPVSDVRLCVPSKRKLSRYHQAYCNYFEDVIDPTHFSPTTLMDCVIRFPHLNSVMTISSSQFIHWPHIPLSPTESNRFLVRVNKVQKETLIKSIYKTMAISHPALSSWKVTSLLLSLPQITSSLERLELHGVAWRFWTTSERPCKYHQDIRYVPSAAFKSLKYMKLALLPDRSYDKSLRYNGDLVKVGVTASHQIGRFLSAVTALEEVHLDVDYTMSENISSGHRTGDTLFDFDSLFAVFRLPRLKTLTVTQIRISASMLVEWLQFHRKTLQPCLVGPLQK